MAFVELHPGVGNQRTHALVCLKHVFLVERNKKLLRVTTTGVCILNFTYATEEEAEADMQKIKRKLSAMQQAHFADAVSSGAIKTVGSSSSSGKRTQ